jgi:hypothetical protein
MSRPGDTFQRERQVLEEELAVPLRRLRRTAGDPTYERIARDSGLCRNTVDNAFNARRLVRWDSVSAIVSALGGDDTRWRERWVAARDRLDAIRRTDDEEGGHRSAGAPACDESIPAPAGARDADPAAAGDRRDAAVSADVRVPVRAAARRRYSRRVRRRLLGAGAVAMSVFGWVVAVAVLASGSVHREDLGAAREPVPGTSSHATVDPAAVHPVGGVPLYVQCSDRDRSILSRPGRARGGVPRGRLAPGERLVVTSSTAYWKYGRVPGASSGRQGWVLAEYLCRMAK